MHNLKTTILIGCLGLFTQVNAQSLKHSAIHIGLVYPLSTNGRDAGQFINDLSIHAIAGLSAGENNASIAGFANICTGTVKGVQAAGFLNMAHSSLIQAGGFVNITDTAQIQAAGFVNKARSSRVQVAGFINKAGTAHTQVAGFVNIAHRTNMQIAGFINIADSCDYPIGLINIIRNGERSLSVTIDETRTTMVTFRSGGRHLYGILGTGFNGRNSQNLWAWEAGVGAHLLNFGSFRLKTEAVAIGLTDFKKGDFFRASIRALPSYRLTNNIECFLGVSLNYIRSEQHRGDQLAHYQWSSRQSSGTLNAGYLGYSGGIAFIL